MPTPNGGISNCNEVPNVAPNNYTNFWDISVFTGTTANPYATNSLTYAPTNQFPIGTQSPQCNWGIGDNSSTTTLWQ